MQKRSVRSADKTYVSMPIQGYPPLMARMLIPHSNRTRLILVFLLGISLGSLLSSHIGRQSEDSLSFIDDEYRFDRSAQVSLPAHDIEIPGHLFMQYLQEYQTQIDGWFSREVLYATWIFVNYQYQHLNIVGGIGEIGVHHGKFTCFLYLLRRSREQKLFAIDVFDNQALNKDGSGRGQKDIFLNNIRKYADIHRIEVAMYAGSSLDLNPYLSNQRNHALWWHTDVVGTRGLQLISVGNLAYVVCLTCDICSSIVKSSRHRKIMLILCLYFALYD
jgi:hypothetical protein